MAGGRQGRISYSAHKTSSSTHLDDRNVDWNRLLTHVDQQNTRMQKAESDLCDIYLRAIFGPYQEEGEERETELPVLKNLRKRLYRRFCESVRKGDVHTQVKEPILFSSVQLNYLESQDWTGDGSGNRYSFQMEADQRAEDGLQLHARQVVLQAIEFCRYIKRGDCKTLPVSQIPLSLLKNDSESAETVDTTQEEIVQDEAHLVKVESKRDNDSDKDFEEQRRARDFEVSAEQSPHFYIQRKITDFYLLAKEKDYTLGIQLELERYFSALEKHTKVQPIVEQLIASMKSNQIVSDEEKLHRLDLLGKLMHHQESITMGSTVRTAGERSLEALAYLKVGMNGRSKLGRRVSFKSYR